MIKDMVLYLLRSVTCLCSRAVAWPAQRQGCYSQDGDIVVLCAYLGQLARVRDELAQHVAIVLDERDSVELADREVENEIEEPVVEHVQVSKRVWCQWTCKYLTNFCRFVYALSITIKEKKQR